MLTPLCLAEHADLLERFPVLPSPCRHQAEGGYRCLVQAQQQIEKVHIAMQVLSHTPFGFSCRAWGLGFRIWAHAGVIFCAYELVQDLWDLLIRSRVTG